MPRTQQAALSAVPAAQQPVWPDPAALRTALAELAVQPHLVSPRECDLLRDQLAFVAGGGAFLLQGGDCAETFAGAASEAVGRKVRLLGQMAEILAERMGLPVVTVGRIAGQYAKPRSWPTESHLGQTLPSYRGDAVNGLAFTPAARTPDPRRLLQAYRTAAGTLAVLRKQDEPASPGDSLLPHPRTSDGGPGGNDFFTSHEALLLPYEEALCRTDPLTGQRYGTSGHLLWIGERTRNLDGAHVRFAAGISNPVGVKLGPAVNPDDVLALVDKLDPQRQPGRLSLIIRMGARKIRDLLPPLVEKVAAEHAPVTWVCDPMHGNTFTAASGHKTRLFDDVFDEVAGFFEVHRTLGTHPGGLHLELTGEAVTECVGGTPAVLMEDLDRRYETACDPRLNADQARELAVAVGGLAARP
ncbi:3-deoxy-D-arabinoheptulosonate-7-phosphate synthase [Saccharopolyspora erythraea NRRL 2338]|uniref:Phospho-2-dehydro-3-deoxyheptonate aldolase n=2 Tax=Saccharopolyspora erythraea TaxID=1836 RepID=A4FL06_SACEN|nr:3-deoxy-7-phosphoheptulonate synthase class II [Saccharopolyspora erythraea]PFG98371.1 3-deoxy-D-arabinoheptulosonate-7-phosphate synthase [Saccharopolyspora erythraea NRRL 2338]QRK88441.1 3-deoxy-7-phosphoheptulonate synthase [Saccharopolyspora erythraea]CAM04731.1 phospho-2-dehydro-3-deoxyheptonate aldolase [Saccharopolyspora erythraea NRRL 2338]